MEIEEVKKQLKETNEKANQLVTELEKTRTEMTKVIESGHAFADISVKYDAISAQLTPLLTLQDQLTTQEKRLSEIQTSLERSEERLDSEGVVKTEHKDAMFDYFRNCVTGNFSDKTNEFRSQAWYQHEMKGWMGIHSLTETVGTDGGFFLTPEMEAEILKNEVEISPIQSIARVSNLTVSNSLKINRRTGEPTALRDTEIGTGTETKSTYAMWEIPVHALTAKTTVTNDLLADVPLFENEVQTDIGEEFARKRGLDHVSGNGVGEPFGIVTNAGTDDTTYPATVTSTTSSVLDKDDFSLMFTILKQAYWGRGRWVFNQSTLKALMQLEATTGNFIWVPGLTAGLANTILGLPFTIAQDVADIGSETLPIYLGDFNRGYRIVTRSGMLTQRDPFTTWPQVVFKFRGRDGAQVVLPESIKILKIRA